MLMYFLSNINIKVILILLLLSNFKSLRLIYTVNDIAIKLIIKNIVIVSKTYYYPIKLVKH